MKKMKKLFAVVLFVCVCGACGDDERDETILEMSLITDKEWYHNAWVGEEEDFELNDLLQVVRFEKGGELTHIDFGGRQEYIVGRWNNIEGSNRIDLHYNNGEKATWHVQNNNNSQLQVIIDGGRREYLSELNYLDNLTTDAFLVNKYTSDSIFTTYISADVRGHSDIREGKILTADGNVNLQNHHYYWAEENPINISFDGEDREVRFYLRIGGNIHLKLKDVIYSANLPERLPTEVALNADEVNGVIKVSWTPYSMTGIYYKVEILQENMDLKNPYFVSEILHMGNSSIEIRSTTSGEVNRITDLESGDSYVVRLTALLYEEGFENDDYRYANIQAVTHFSKEGLKK